MKLPGPSVYFAKCVTADGVDMNAVKIGCSYGFSERLSALEANMPFNCEFLCSLPGTFFLERFMHFWLRNDRIGGEYFRFCPELKKIVSSIKTTGSLPFSLTLADPKFDDIQAIDCVSFMQERGISFRDISKHTGVIAARYRTVLNKDPSGNRRLASALAVTAVRKGQSVKWPHDLLSKLPHRKGEAA